MKNTIKDITKRFARRVGFIATLLIMIATNKMTVLANEGANVVRSGLTVLYDIIGAFATGFGVIVILWGLVEWGVAMSSQDGTVQAHAIKRIAGGIIIALGAQLALLIFSA